MASIDSLRAWVSGGREAVALVTDLGGKGTVEELGVIEGAVLEIPEGPVARVGNTASAGKVSMSTAGDESTGAAFFFSASSFKYSASMRWMSGTWARRHNSVINTGMGEMSGAIWPSCPSLV
ncbi:hypothetical protein H5410_040559 [Solanum commersonii]|uniref:Uncharacterized protein n=1 Tax=Solanum commersonii TaxID=4109 RepID=A0A9J5XQG0_SOLCO|nr:hypothetical protein H5410_040559 [Solanum commersonii]